MGSAPETNNEAAPPAPEPIPATSRPLSGLRARIEKSTTFGRLVRSNSEQIPSALSASGKYTDGSRLKKAGTFEGVMGARPRKPVVVIADPPEDDSDRDPARGSEVDKKAEDFISRFYEKMKLQRIDSLVRRQREAASR
ncbi:hypothetical protein KP509_17G025700 [Ceratopteris richardii]|nr:hypothetical protein KP509_17G025700 [Ceratopteris richardii]